MSTERETRQAPEGFGELFAWFDRAGGVDSRGRAADEIVRFATEENTDWKSVLRAIHKGYQAFSGRGRDKIGGRRMLKGINDYMEGLGLVIKAMIAGSEPMSPNDEGSIQKLLELINKNKSKTEIRASNKEFENINNILIRVKSALPVLVEANQNASFHIYSERVRNGRNDDEIDEEFDNRTNGVNKILRNADREGQLSLPVRILEWAKNQTKIEGAPHPYTAKFNGVSLEDIEADEDVASCVKKILLFRTGVPKGDLLWNELSRYPISPVPTKISQEAFRVDPAGVPEFTKRIVKAQRLIADWFFHPGFSGVADSEIDNLIKNFLSSMSKSAIENEVASIYQNALTGVGNLIALDGGVNRGDYIKFFPLNAHATGQFVNKYSMYRLIPDNAYISHFFSSNRSEIVENLKERFAPDNSNWPVIEDILQRALSIDMIPIQKRIFFNKIYENVGENFTARLNAQEQYLNHLSKDIWKDIDNASYLPHTEVRHEVEFSEDSLPERMGLENITFGVNMYGVIEFNITPKKGQGSMVLYGKIDKDGEISIVTKPDENYPGLEALIKNIAVMSYHDLTIRNSIAQEKLEERGERRRQSQKRESQPRTLPRKQVLYTRGETGEWMGTARSDDLVQIANEEGMRRGFEPRFVDSFVRKLPGAYEYLAALVPLLFPKDGIVPVGAERARIIREIIRARKAMYKPSKEKLDALPKAFKLNYHDWSAKNRVYVENWVTEHPSPKLDPDEEESVAVHYQKRYRGGASLAFLNYLKTWIG